MCAPAGSARTAARGPPAGVEGGVEARGRGRGRGAGGSTAGLASYGGLAHAPPFFTHPLRHRPNRQRPQPPTNIAKPLKPYRRAHPLAAHGRLHAARPQQRPGHEKGGLVDVVEGGEDERLGRLLVPAGSGFRVLGFLGFNPLEYNPETL